MIWRISSRTDCCGPSPSILGTQGTLTYTVVTGEILGNYEATAEPAAPA